MDEEQARDWAFAVIGEFEELLDRHHIRIPSRDREGWEEEACIYGSEYYELEDAIVDLLMHRDAGDKGDW